MKRAWLLCLVLAACEDGEHNQGKLMPKLAPAPDVPIPAGLSIPLELDGKPAGTLDAAKLGAMPPDFADDQRKAWRIPTLFGRALPDRAVVKVTGTGGVTVELPSGGESATVPVLLVSRRAEVVAMMLDPKEPFPDYHGKGGRLGRPNDPLPRIAEVSRIAVTAPPGGP